MPQCLECTLHSEASSNFVLLLRVSHQMSLGNAVV